jgi:hypothetical protein
VGIKEIEKYIKECKKTNKNPFPEKKQIKIPSQIKSRIILANPALELKAADSAINILKNVGNPKVFSINTTDDILPFINPFFREVEGF